MANVALGKRVEEQVNNPMSITDGEVTGYTGTKGFSTFPWPGYLTVDLGESFDLCCIRILLWDGLGQKGAMRDPRIYKYRLLVSSEHDTWKVIYDTGPEGYNGWQIFNFSEILSCRYIRFHGIWNSSKPHIHIVQVEAHDTDPPNLNAEITLERNIQTKNLEEEIGDGLPLTSRLRQIINSLETLIDLNQYLKPEPFQDLITDLRIQVNNIGSIEMSMDAIRSEITEPVNQELKKSTKLGKFSVWGFWVGLIGGCLAIISLLVGLVGFENNRKIQFLNFLKKQNKILQEKVQQSQEGSSKLREEISKLQTQVKVASKTTDLEGTSHRIEMGEPIPQDSNYIETTIEEGQTQTYFNKDLYITIVAVEWATAPFRHLAWINISGKGLPSKKLDKVEAGTVVQDDKYEIRISNVSSGDVTFIIKKK